MPLPVAMATTMLVSAMMYCSHMLIEEDESSYHIDKTWMSCWGGRVWDILGVLLASSWLHLLVIPLLTCSKSMQVVGGSYHSYHCGWHPQCQVHWHEAVLGIVPDTAFNLYNKAQCITTYWWYYYALQMTAWTVPPSWSKHKVWMICTVFIYFWWMCVVWRHI